MSNPLLPPTPFRSALVDQSGLMTPIWSNWFKQLYLRTGQADAPSNTDIINNSTALLALQTQVAVLQTSVATHTSAISTLTTEFQDLSVGRQL